jgi:hypothetical protein
MIDTRREFLIDYITTEIQENGLDEYGQIEINFSDLCELEEAEEVAKELGYVTKSGQGQGVLWLYKED